MSNLSDMGKNRGGNQIPTTLVWRGKHKGNRGSERYENQSSLQSMHQRKLFKHCAVMKRE